MEISEGVIRLGLRPRRITPSSISIILHKILSLIKLIFTLLSVNFKKPFSEGIIAPVKGCPVNTCIHFFKKKKKKKKLYSQSMPCGYFMQYH